MSFKTHRDNPIYNKRHQKIPRERCKRRSKSTQDCNWVIVSNDEVILKSLINKSLNYRSKNWKKHSEITEKLYSRSYECCLQVPLLPKQPKTTTKNHPTKRWILLFVFCTALWIKISDTQVYSYSSVEQWYILVQSTRELAYGTGQDLLTLMKFMNLTVSKSPIMDLYMVQ